MRAASRALLRPGGRLYLGVPIGRDLLVYNAHRVYGVRQCARARARDCVAWGARSRALRAARECGFVRVGACLSRCVLCAEDFPCVGAREMRSRE